MAQHSSSIIAAGTVIRGRITATGDLEIHGHVEGSVTSEGTVTVGPEGLVKSDLEAEHLIVAGAVAGNLRGSESVVLEDGARVIGDVSAPSIGIRPGAKLRGRVATGAVSPKASTSAAPRTAPATRVAPRTTVNPSVPVTRPVQAAPVKAAPVKAAPVKAAPVKAAPAQAAPLKAAPVKEAPVKEAPKAAPQVKRPPEPVVPVLQKRTKKAVKRRSR